MARANKAKRPPKPDRDFFDPSWIDQAFSRIAGIDEAGRGCLAGPVVAAAVIFPPQYVIEGVADSKSLTPARRERLYELIDAHAVDWAWAMVDACEIDEINILQASLKAMRLAVTKLRPQPEALLTDGLQHVEHQLPQRTVVRGDQCCHSIAAASIMAKVTRDRLMSGYVTDHPGFAFDVHKGYGTAGHLEELRRFGPTPLHRKTFRGVVS